MLELVMNQPLPERLRPKVLDDVIGQSHLLGEDGALRKLLDQNYLPSIIFWGPPGVGKTTLAYILAKHFGYDFIELSGVEFSVKALEELKKPASKVNKKLSNQLDMFTTGQSQSSINKDDSAKPTVIFVDEIHRLNKSQQAQFLPYVERGEWILIGATTENPSFEVIAPLLSRAQVVVLKTLTEDELMQIVEKGINELNPDWKISPEVKTYLVQIANGDARMLLNATQALYQMYPVGQEENLDREAVKTALGNLHLVYDKGGDEHYDTISALHKSMRGSDPTASLYYLARMLEAGEDPLYVARRCVRFASEDIGNAAPTALVLANAVFETVQKIGMPEANTALAQLVLYLARAPKSNEAYVGYKRARDDIQRYGNLPIPLKLRNAPTKLMTDVGYGKDYKYAHDFTPEELAEETYMPDQLAKTKYVD